MSNILLVHPDFEQVWPYASNRPQEVIDLLKERGVRVYNQPSVGYWGQSVSEFGLA
jgi:hypothetical protein